MAAYFAPQGPSILRTGVAPKRVDPTWDAVGGLGLSAGVHAHTQMTSPCDDSMLQEPCGPGLRGGGSSADEDGVATDSQKVQLAELMLREHNTDR
jgi:hypothetical protein